jgi:hypothetical protein
MCDLTNSYSKVDLEGVLKLISIFPCKKLDQTSKTQKYS